MEILWSDVDERPFYASLKVLKKKAFIKKNLLTSFAEKNISLDPQQLIKNLEKFKNQTIKCLTEIIESTIPLIDQYKNDENLLLSLCKLQKTLNEITPDSTQKILDEIFCKKTLIEGYEKRGFNNIQQKYKDLIEWT